MANFDISLYVTQLLNDEQQLFIHMLYIIIIYICSPSLKTNVTCIFSNTKFVSNNKTIETIYILHTFDIQGNN